MHASWARQAARAAAVGRGVTHGATTRVGVTRPAARVLQHRAAGASAGAGWLGVAGFCAAAASVAAVGATTSVAHAGEFGSCDVVGDGLKGEFWKARHKNINVLELESEVMQIMMTQLRNKELSDKGFVLLAERVAFFIIEHALAELPTKETTVETVSGHKYTGVSLDESVKLCGIGVAENGGQMLSILTKLRPDMPVAHLQINRGTRHLSLIPSIKDLYERHCLVLCPVMKTGQTALDSVGRLIKAGAEPENIILVSITAGPGALDRFAKEFPDVSVVTGSVEAGLDKQFQLMPGVGVFELRYRREEDEL